jgi:hypothetical protein
VGVAGRGERATRMMRRLGQAPIDTRASSSTKRLGEAPPTPARGALSRPSRHSLRERGDGGAPEGRSARGGPAEGPRRAVVEAAGSVVAPSLPEGEGRLGQSPSGVGSAGHGTLSDEEHRSCQPQGHGLTDRSALPLRLRRRGPASTESPMPGDPHPARGSRPASALPCGEGVCAASEPEGWRSPQEPLFTDPYLHRAAPPL